MPFEVSLKECFSNFLRDFFFFTDLVGWSNSWLNTVAHIIRLISNYQDSTYFLKIGLKGQAAPAAMTGMSPLLCIMLFLQFIQNFRSHTFQQTSCFSLPLLRAVERSES
jgi:hypothetical protein